jgi:hypothetical protein
MEDEDYNKEIGENFTRKKQELHGEKNTSHTDTYTCVCIHVNFFTPLSLRILFHIKSKQQEFMVLDYIIFAKLYLWDFGFI